MLSAIVPESFHKFDRFGLPAYYMKAGKVNPDLLLKFVTVDDMVTTHLWGQEYSFKRAEEKSKELGRNIDQFVNIVDLQGLTMSHRSCLKSQHNTTQHHSNAHSGLRGFTHVSLCWCGVWGCTVGECGVFRFMTTVAALDSQYYPESLGKTYIINAPWIFPALWKLIRGSLDPVTAEKIHVLGHNYQEVLRERFESADLPSEYGGTCRCAGGCIPEFTEAEAMVVIEQAEKKLNLEEMTLSAGQQHSVKLDFGPWGGSVHVYLKSLKADIGFQAVFTPKHPSAVAVSLKGRRKSSTGETKSGAVDAVSLLASPSSSASSSSTGVRECPYGETTWQEHHRFPPQVPNKMTFVSDYAGTAVLTFDNKHSWRHAETFRFKISVTEGKEGVKKEGMHNFTATVHPPLDDAVDEPTNGA